MVNKKKDPLDGFFQNTPDFFQKFKGKIVSSEYIKQFDFSNLNVAIVGANQRTVTHLDQIAVMLNRLKYFKLLHILFYPIQKKAFINCFRIL